MKRLILVASMAAVFASCQQENKTSQTIETTLEYHYDSVKVYSKNPVSANAQVTDTAKAVISYPVFRDPAINEFVESKALNTAGPDITYQSYQDYTQDFIKGFDEFQAKNKDRIQTWFLNIRTEVVAQKSNYLSFYTKFINFSGGAHPNSVFIYSNYNPVTHQEIILDSLIQPGSLGKLTAIGEMIFRENEKIGPTENLKDKYFFENDQFKLNENFTITDKGLLFLYNPYEIKAYVYGTTELLIPFDLLKDIAKPNSLLAN